MSSRLERLGAVLEEPLLVTTPANVRYLTGFESTNAALRLSGRPTTVVEKLLAPRPVRVDRERAWAALGRDKKSGLVLLGEDGPRWDVQVPEEDVRRELDALIAD